ncbi:MAG: hypothetical protein K6F05_06815 [Succinivibrio sp.]|nr:hypothetical protein [Succinivibrio sp.]
MHVTNRVMLLGTVLEWQSISKRIEDGLLTLHFKLKTVERPRHSPPHIEYHRAVVKGELAARCTREHLVAPGNILFLEGRLCQGFEHGVKFGYRSFTEIEILELEFVHKFQLGESLIGF